MQIAIASTDGKSVNTHFGKADKFIIYEQRGIKLSRVKEIDVEPYSTGNQQHIFDKQRFSAVSTPLSQCSTIYCTKIGEKPAEEFRKMGIDIVIFEGLIENIPL